MRICRVCRIAKDNFYKRANGTYVLECMDCRKAAANARYRKKKEAIIENTQLIRQRFNEGDRSAECVRYVLGQLAGKAGVSTRQLRGVQIPHYCPYANIPLHIGEGGVGAGSPSLRIIDTELAIQPSKVEIISLAANVLFRMGLASNVVQKIYTEGGIWCRGCWTILPELAFTEESLHEYAPTGLCGHCTRKRNAQGNYKKEVLRYMAGDRSDAVVLVIKRRLIQRAIQRAKAYGLPCTITETDIDIPERCPVLDIPLTIGTDRDSSMSLDRIIPDRGYIPGNVAVISMRANTIKSDASIDELAKVLSWLRTTMSVDR